MNPIDTLKRRGVGGTAAYAVHAAKQRFGWYAHRFRHVPRYQPPNAADLARIENALLQLGIGVGDYRVDVPEFRRFQGRNLFPTDYHGGMASGVWDEKLLEHFIAADLLGLKYFRHDDVYVDIAACNSPWAHALRTRCGLNAYAIDLAIGSAYRDLPYYRQENATSMGFADASVKGASLQCAFEMFMAQDDTAFVAEVGRILAPGGKVVILPLYMHTHYCAYATPEYWGQGFSDARATEYIRLDCAGVPSSRKYDALALKQRVLDPIRNQGLHYRLMALRNKEDLNGSIYCHFILEITR